MYFYLFVFSVYSNRYKTSYNNLEAIYSSGKWNDPGTLLKVSMYNFSVLKNMKKRVYRNDRTILP